MTVQTAKHIDQAKSFLTKNVVRIAFRALPLALFAVGLAHAANNGGPLVFSAPSNMTVSGTGCGAAATTPLAGQVYNSSTAVRLYGAVYATNPENCNLLIKWSGTGSGLMYGGNLTLNDSFTITPDTFTSISGWTLTVIINGNSTSVDGCTVPQQQQGFMSFKPQGSGGGYGATCMGAVLSNGLSIPVSGALSTWEVDLQINGVASDGGGLTVNVPGLTSIDLLGQSSPAPVPALSPLAFIMTGLLLFSLAGFGLLRRTSADTGFPV